ncbi:MAG: histidine kinase [Saprospiraceae bacterium]|nr:histidine kinase [Saprospiraceae bacterium]
MKNKTVQILLLVATAVTMRAQSPNFKTCRITEAYPNAKVELMYEDRNSLIWFGSTQGLFLFDGIEFIQFLKGDTTSQHVRAIYQDKKKKLWIGYEDGTIYYLQGKKLQQWMPEEGTPKVPIMGFAEDQTGRRWMATYGEGVYYTEDGRLYNFNMDDGLAGDEIYVMAQDGQGRIWLGTDGGISICSVKDGKKRVENLTREDGLPDEIVREIMPDESGNMWIGSFDQGVCLYKIKERRFDFPLKDWNHGTVNRLALFKDKELWIGTEGNGLWRYSLQDERLRQLKGGKNLERAKIYDLHRDIEGNIWMVSNTEGITYANRQFEFLQSSDHEVQAMIVDREDRLWIGTPEGLFSGQLGEDDLDKFQAYFGNLGLNIISLFSDSFGRIWIGSFGKGAFCFDPKTGRIRQFSEKNGLANDNVLSIAGANEKVWLATLGGVSEIENSANLLDGGPPVVRNYQKKDGLSTDYIYKVLIDSKKRTWFATDGQGISKLENGKISNYSMLGNRPTSNSNLQGGGLKAVYSLTEDHDGNLWVSTAADGIFKFDGTGFTHLAMKEGLRDLAITGLVTDAKGQIVIVHPSGIDLLTPSTTHLIYYDEELGLGEIEPHLNATCSDRWGNIWIGVKKGIIKYTPLSEALEIDPRTRLEAVSASLVPIDFQQVTQFAYDQNDITFNYMGLWYTDPTSVKYRYKLSGHNPDWILSKDRQANYPQLPPGNYTFMVTSTENEAWLDEPVITWSFEIMPPFWRRWWFILTSILLGAGLFYWYLITRDKRKQKVVILEKEKVENELAVIKAQINPHFLFNSFNTLIAVIEEDPSAAVEYVEKLSDFYRSMLQLRDKEVITLNEEAELIEHYGYLLKKRYGDNFNLNVNLNGQTGYIMPLTLQILVENAVKHNVISKLKPLVVDIRMEENDCISVANNLQPKVQPEASTKFGLASLQRRYEMLNGRGVEVEKTATHFKVRIPIIH